MAELCSPTHLPQKPTQPSAKRKATITRLTTTDEEQATCNYKQITQPQRERTTPAKFPTRETLAATLSTQQKLEWSKQKTPQHAQHRRSQSEDRPSFTELQPAEPSRVATTTFNLNNGALFKTLTWVLISTTFLCLCTHHTAPHSILLPTLTPTVHSLSRPHILKSLSLSILPTSSSSHTHYQLTKPLHSATRYPHIHTNLSLSYHLKLPPPPTNAPPAHRRSTSPPMPPTHPTITQHKVRKNTRTYHQTRLHNKQLQQGKYTILTSLPPKTLCRCLSPPHVAKGHPPARYLPLRKHTKQPHRFQLLLSAKGHPQVNSSALPHAAKAHRIASWPPQKTHTKQTHYCQDHIKTTTTLDSIIPKTNPTSDSPTLDHITLPNPTSHVPSYRNPYFLRSTTTHRQQPSQNNHNSSTHTSPLTSIIYSFPGLQIPTQTLHFNTHNPSLPHSYTMASFNAPPSSELVPQQAVNRRT